MLENEINRIKNEIVQIRCESPDLHSVLVDFLSGKSKFIRSYISLLLLRASGVEVLAKHYYVMKVIELIHNSSLIHDDVIDESDVRRDKMSINKRFSSKFAVIAGDYLITTAVNELLELDEKEFIIDTIKQMCLAESNQYFLKGRIPTLDEYLEKTERKTANLFVAAARALGLGDSEQRFAYCYGMAFQIRNDLDNFLDSGSDVENEIYTAPNILSVEKTLDLIHNYSREGTSCLDKFPKSEYKQELIKQIEDLCRLKK